MKKLLLSLAICSTQISIAQSVDTYIFKVETGKAYTPLTTGTNITPTLVWDEENFKVPLGFTANIGGKSTTNFSIATSGVFAIASDTIGKVNAFMPFAADLIDRSFTSTPESPIRYLVTGTTPNRIFKLEFFNAGFFEEYNLYGTNDDSVNFQVWVYETSNIVEFRYGSSKITNPSDYFDGAAPLIGYGKNFDLDLYTFDKLYFLNGTSASPKVDSITSITSIPTSLSNYPASGTVYRFIPKTVAASIGESSIATKFQVYPTLTADKITVISDNVAATSGKFIDLNGKVVTVIQNIENGKNTFDVSNLASGNYLLEITNAEGKAVYKFTKQ